MMGQTISHYKIVEKLGAGGMGEVFLAEDLELKRQVALKFLPAHMSTDPESKTRFKREAQALAALNHPHIVSVYEVAEFEGQPYIAMEYVKGRTLKQLVQAGDVALDSALDIMAQSADGLTAAHKAEIIHRDIKSDNIVVSNDGQVKIMDFGLATWKGVTKVTKSGSTLGTMSYMSPEQAEGREVDHRSDLFSLGVVFYEMITGHLPFAGEHEAAVLYAISHDEPEPLARYKSGVHAEIQGIVTKALAKTPALRYQSAAEMATDIRRLSLPAATRVPRTSRRFRLWVAALVIAAATAGYWGYSRFQSRSTSGAAHLSRVAVLSFANMSSEDEAYFADGITEDITSRLTEVQGIAVLSRSTSNKIKASDDGPSKAGKSLGVDYVLDGSIRWQENSDGIRRLRVVTQLIRTSDDVNVWSHTYDTVMSESFAVQSDIAQKVSEQMGILLSPRQKEQLWKRWTNSPEAWDYYLRGGKQAWRHSGFGEQALRSGLELYSKAVEIDSNFALAMALMSRMYSRLYFFKFETADSIRDLTWSLANRASRIQPDCAAAWVSKADYYYRCQRDYAKALEAWDQAYKENRVNNLFYLQQTHHVLRRAGQFEEAYNRLKRAVELDPTDTFKKNDLQGTCAAMRRFEEASNLIDEVIRKEPDFLQGYAAKLAMALYGHGDVPAARAAIELSAGKIDASIWVPYYPYLDILEGHYEKALAEAPSIDEDSLAYYRFAAQIFDYMSDSLRMRVYSDSALAGTERQTREHPDDAVAWGDLGLLYARLGRKAEAIEAGERAVAAQTVADDAIEGWQGIQYLIIILCRVGEVDRAMEQFEYLLSIPCNFNPAYVAIDPDFAPLTKHPRFKELLAAGGKVF